MSNEIHIGGRAIVVVALVLIVAWFVMKPRTRQDKEGFAVVSFQDTDPKMNAAIKEARATLPEFVAALSDRKPSRELFGVKTKVEDAYGRAHVWIVDVTFENDVFTGTLVNTPRNVRELSAGQTMHVPSQEVSDWSFVENGTLVGGYTMRVMWDRLSESERKTLESKLGFKID